MSYLRTHCTVLGCTLLLMVGLSAQTLAQSTAPKGGEPYGDWETKVTVNRKQRTSVLSLYSDPKGNQTGQWVSLQKLGELKDLKYEAGKLSFIGEDPSRDGQSTTWEFTGTIKEEDLSGCVLSDQAAQRAHGPRQTHPTDGRPGWELRIQLRNGRGHPGVWRQR